MAIALQDLLDAATNAPEGTTPEAAVAKFLADNASDADVAALQAEAIDKFEALRDAGVNNVDDLAAATALADVADGTRLEQARLDTAAAEHQERVEALAKRVRPEAAAQEDESTKTAEESAAAEVEPEPTETSPEADASGVVEAAEAATAEAAEAALVASAKPKKRVRVSDLPAQRAVAMPPAVEDAQPRAAILASADVAGFGAGQNLTTSDLAKAANSKLQGFPQGFVPNQEMAVPVASISIPFEDALVASGSNDQEAIDYAADTSRLEGGSLVAAGGWCAPSETLYELGGILADAEAGLVSIPEVQAKRGGLRYTEGPDYAAIYGDATFGFIQTETQAIAGSGFTTATGGTVAGTQKPFYRVPCPSFTEDRAEAVGLGIVAGILANDAYPEMTTEVVEHGLIAHSHRINTRTLNRQAALSGTPIVLALGPSATTAVLNTLDIQIADYRYANRMADNSELEVVLPLWAKPLFRADMSVRNGSDVTEALDVTDAKIEAWFKARHAAPQWVYDWQDAFSGVSGGFGSTAAITSWPDTMDIMIYKAGTFVRARGEIINVSAMYDTVNLKNNDYHVLFIEEKLLVIKRRWKSRLVRVALAVNGAVGAARQLDSDGKIVVTP
ncbi:hypothetical protein CH265_12190 [Rhodococcus sp. 05-2221-1B]|uniref:major capsid protein n=1 Tax=Rhodococcus sp. 05-2221-1B TaxID=2022498 RepID=UPI000B9A5D3B|nr:major capsid protein [Rhodococcus sp. 05-2221-1B]OZE63629.1 hypothetical protein CH265_12190 [Rhodococcus sp. 05-2221-1B]